MKSHFSIFLLYVFLLISSKLLIAQTGFLTGKIIEQSNSEPITGVTVKVIKNESSQRQLGAITSRDGSYKVKNIPIGKYKVIVSCIGYETVERENVEISADKTTELEIVIRPGNLNLDEIIVSASRRQEKVTTAPASVSIINTRTIQEKPTVSIADHLKGITGLDVIQSGLTQNNIVARGFNNLFSGALMVITDNKIASVPSLRLNAYNFIPLVNDDIQQIEVIRGPGAALYGPNTASGVMHIITKSPFSSQGTNLSFSTGTRDLLQGTIRHAGVIGENLGYKISGQYLKGTDWSYVDPAEVKAISDWKADTTKNINGSKIGIRDSTIEKYSGELRLDYLPMNDMTIIGAFGFNNAVKNMELTGVGAGQAQNWQYMYFQGRFLFKDLFFQIFRNQSNAGTTYLLRTGQQILDKSTTTSAQIQHSYQPISLIRLTYGADLVLTNPVTDSTITGSNENDDNTTEIGSYLQSDIKVNDQINLVGAGRIDKHSRLEDVIFSPRAAIVYNPIKDQSLRLTFNRAFSTPGTNELFLDIIAGKSAAFNIRATGIPKNGFTFEMFNGRPLMHSPFKANKNEAIPIDSINRLWPEIQGFLKTKGYDITSIPAPPAGVVKVDVKSLNTSAGDFSLPPLTGNLVSDRKPVAPTITTTTEFGYKGVLFDKLSLSLDLYTSHYKDFVGPLQVITPTVFMRYNDLKNYFTDVLKASGMRADSAAVNAAGLAIGCAGIPLGQITPREAINDPTAVILTYRNYGDITLNGYDFGFQYNIFDNISIVGNMSGVNKNFFENLDSVADLALNAPKFKYAFGVNYHNNSLGFNAEAKLRHIDSFRVNSGAYIGSIPSYSIVDLTVGYQLPFLDGASFILSATNLLTFVDGGNDNPFIQRHAEVIGAPAIGSMIIGKLSYNFK